MGRKAGLNDEQLLAVREVPTLSTAVRVGHPELFSDLEQLVIELADAMVTAPANISDELYERLRQQFSEEQLLELSAQIAFENFRARLNRVFDFGSDELYRSGAAN